MTTESKLQVPNGGWVTRALPTEPIPNRALWERGRGQNRLSDLSDINAQSIPFLCRAFCGVRHAKRKIFQLKNRQWRSCQTNENSHQIAGAA